MFILSYLSYFMVLWELLSHTAWIWEIYSKIQGFNIYWFTCSFHMHSLHVDVLNALSSSKNSDKTTAEIQLDYYSWWILEALLLSHQPHASDMSLLLITRNYKMWVEGCFPRNNIHIILHQDLPSAACCTQVDSTLLHRLEVPNLHLIPKTSHHGILFLLFCSTHPVNVGTVMWVCTISNLLCTNYPIIDHFSYWNHLINHKLIN